MDTLKIVGQVAGIGGLALGVLMLIFRDVIRKNIFPTLSKEHAYRVLRLIVFLVWSVALVGIGAWVLTSKTAGGIIHPYTRPILTDGQTKQLEDELKAAGWCQENNRPRQALEHYRKALEIDKGNPEIVEAIKMLQKQLAGGSNE